MMIRTVIKIADGMVMVFDKMVEQIHQYQGQYTEVKALILRYASPEARFGYFPNGGQELRIVPRGGVVGNRLQSKRPMVAIYKITKLAFAL